MKALRLSLEEVSQREFCIFTTFFHLLHGSLVYLFSVNRRYLALQSSKRLVRQAIKLLLQVLYGDALPRGLYPCPFI